MPNRTDRSDPPPPPGPWPEVTDLSRLFDHGAPWCVNAAGHPPRDGGYPDPQVHVPPFECRTAALYLDKVRADLTGPVHGLEICAARPFQYGEPRTAESVSPTRVVFEYLDAADRQSARFSLALGDTLRLARHLERLVNVIDTPPIQ